MFDSNKINAPTAPMPRNPKLGSKCRGLWIAILAIATGITTGSVSADEVRHENLIFSYQVDEKEGVSAFYGPDQGHIMSEQKLEYLPGDTLKVPIEMLEAMKNGAKIVDYVIVIKGSPYRFLRCRWLNGDYTCR
jgi:hypothetical protein